MPVVKDRRSSLRVEVEGRARISTERDAFEGRCVDLGLDGIAIRSTRAARPGEQVTLEAQVAGQRLRIEATLVRRQRAGGEYLLGLAFVDVDLDTQRRIEHLLFEQLAKSPQGDFMRAFVAYADRVPPAAAREGGSERTMVVAGTLLVPVVSGHTQVIAMDQIPIVDRTVIAPAPVRPDPVPVDAPRTTYTPPVAAAGVADDAWLEDEIDTAQFRLLEAAQAQEAELELDDDELRLLEPGEPTSDHTVVVGGFAAPPRERTLVTGDDALERPLRERTLVTGDDALERPLRERTLVTGDDALERPIRERTLVTGDAVERPLRERTLVTGDGVPEPVALVHTSTLPVTLEPEPEPRPMLEPQPERPSERTLPFVRDFLPSSHVDALAPHREPAEHTAVAGSRSAEEEPSSTRRALLEATALLRRPDSGAQRKRGPRVIVAIPHRTYRRVAATPWNRR